MLSKLVPAESDSVNILGGGMALLLTAGPRISAPALAMRVLRVLVG